MQPILRTNDFRKLSAELSTYGGREPDWWKMASCDGMDTSIFFAFDDETIAKAIQICQSCPARLACLSEALELNYPDGIWGGVISEDRRRYKRFLYRESLKEQRIRYRTVRRARDNQVPL